MWRDWLGRRAGESTQALSEQKDFERACRGALREKKRKLSSKVRALAGLFLSFFSASHSLWPTSLPISFVEVVALFLTPLSRVISRPFLGFWSSQLATEGSDTVPPLCSSVGVVGSDLRWEDRGNLVSTPWISPASPAERFQSFCLWLCDALNVPAEPVPKCGRAIFGA
jgi:hypothetical protein